MSATHDSVIDRDTFEALKEAAGAEFVRELIDAFVEDSAGVLQALRTAVASGDVDAFRRAAHTLKSNGMTFGAEHLGALARGLEAEASACVQSGSTAQLDAIAAEHARVVAALEVLRNG